MIFQSINIGHLHPLLVHLPIGILIVLFVLEFLLRNKKTDESEKILSYILLLAFIASVLSLLTGWRLGGEGGYEGDLIRLHKWTAVGLTVAVGFLTALKLAKKPELKKLYWPLLMVVLLLLTITGHYGASMTHGENFLFEHKEPTVVSISDVNEALVYADIIRPMFENHCTSCHNTGKTNGGLIMTSKEALLKGGNSGNFFAESGKSSALQRVNLPLEEKEHMPPNGKLQLSEEQLFYLEWWMENEHCFDCKVTDLAPTERELTFLRKLEQDNSSTALLERTLKPLPNEWVNQLVSEGISVTPLDKSSKLLSIKLSQSSSLAEHHFKLLTKHSEHIIELNLSSSDFSDKWKSYLPEFTNLIKLQLQNTSITNQTASAINTLELLESVNFYGTSINRQALEELEAMPSLERIYVWKTEVTANDVKEFNSKNSNLEIIGQFESPLLAESKLDNPYIRFRKTLFEDTLHVKLETDFDGARLYYTLDGTRPDTSSFLYTENLVLDKSTIVSAMCYKPDWGKSEVTAATFKQLILPIQKAEINGALHENYQSNGPNAIKDGLLGSTDFKDGRWLGFQGVSPEFILSIDDDKEFSNVSVSAMSAQPSWIFYPKGFTIYVSDNKVNWRKVHYSSEAPVKQEPETERRFFDLRFEPVVAKYIKVEIESFMRLPEWHASPGEPCYVFIDEVIVE
ncbi:MAG: FN3 associated domain-containing protein [Flavobacteriales bacterium]